MNFTVINLKTQNIVEKKEGIDNFEEDEILKYRNNNNYIVLDLDDLSPTEKLLWDVLKKQDVRPKKYDKVEILWVDSESATGWSEMDIILDNYNIDGNLLVRSVGYLVKENKLFCTLVQSLDEKNNNIDNYITIPVCSIQKKTILN